MAYDISDFELAEAPSPVAKARVAPSTSHDLSDFEVASPAINLGLEQAYPEALNPNIALSSYEEIKPPVKPTTLEQVEALPKTVVDTLGGTGLKQAGGELLSSSEAIRKSLQKGERREATTEQEKISSAKLRDTISRRLGEGSTNNEATVRKDIERKKVADQLSRGSEDPALVASEREALGKGLFEEAGEKDNAPKGAVTSIAKGLTKGAGLMAEAALGLPAMVAAGASQAYGEAKNSGKTEDEAQKEGVKTILSLAAFGGSNKVVSSGIAKFLGNAPALKTFLVQTLGQAAGNELTSRVLNAYDAAVNAPEGQKLKAAAEAAKKFDLESTAQNIGFAALGGLEAAGHAETPEKVQQDHTDFVSQIQAIPDEEFSAAIKKYRVLPDSDPRKKIFEQEIVRRNELSTSEPVSTLPTTTEVKQEPSEVQQVPVDQTVSSGQGKRSSLFEQAAAEKAAAEKAAAVQPLVQAAAEKAAAVQPLVQAAGEAKTDAPAAAAAAEKAAETIQETPTPESGGEALFPSPRLNFRGGEKTKFSDAVSVHKVKNDQGKDVYEILYKKGNQTYLGFSDNPLWEFHESYKDKTGEVASAQEPTPAQEAPAALTPEQMAADNGVEYQGSDGTLHHFKDTQTNRNFSIAEGSVTPQKVAEKTKEMRSEQVMQPGEWTNEDLERLMVQAATEKAAEKKVAAPESTTVATPEANSRPVELRERQKQNGLKLYEIDASKLDEAWKKDGSFFYLPKEGKGESEISGRRENFKDWLSKNPDKPIQAADVNIGEDGTVSFTDGRHRTRVMMDSGREKIPVALTPEDAQRAVQHGLLDPSQVEGGEPAQEPPQAQETPTRDVGTHLTSLLDILGEEEAPKAEEKSAPMKRWADMNTEERLGVLEGNLKNARNNRERADIRKKIQALKGEVTEAVKTEEKGEEVPETGNPTLDELLRKEAAFLRATEGKTETGPKEIWQKTRFEAEADGVKGYSYMKAVKDAVQRGDPVPKDVLDEFKKKYSWAREAKITDSPEKLAKGVQGLLDALKQLPDDEKGARRMNLRKRRGEEGSTTIFNEIGERVVDAGKIAFQKGMTAVQWAGEMIKAFGEKVRPFLRDAWSKVVEWNRSMGEAGAIGAPGGGGRKLGEDRRAFIESVGRGPLREAVKAGIEMHNSGAEAPDVLKRSMDVLRQQMQGKPFDEEAARRFFSPDAKVEEQPQAQPEEVQPPAVQAEPPQPEPQPQTEEPTPQTEIPQPEPRSTSTKNAVMEQERIARGQAPIAEPVREAVGDVWDKAVDAAKATPDASGTLRTPEHIKQLVRETIDNPKRAISTEEEAVLLAHKVDLQNRIHQAVTISNDESAPLGDRQEARLRSAQLLEENNDLDAATKARGTVWGRLGQFRQQLANEDFSLSAMLQRARTSQGDNFDANSEQWKSREAEIVRQQKEIEDLNKKLAEHAAKKEKKRAEKAVDEAVEKMVSESKRENQPKETEKPEKQSRRPLTKAIIDYARGQRQAAIDRINARRGKLMMALEPVTPFLTRFADEIIIGASHIVEGAATFAEWSKKMIGDLSDEIKPNLRPLFKASKEQAKGLMSSAPRDIPAERTSTLEGMKNRLSEGDNMEDLSRYVQVLAKQFVEQGVHERDPLIDAVHNELKSIAPDISREKTRDLISGYGQSKELSKEATDVTLRDLKGQMQQVAKIESMMAGKAPLKTGVERRIPSDVERRLVATVNELKKKGGFEVTDPEKQLRTSLDAIKTRLRNQIADYDFQISTGKKILKDKTAAPSDAETEALRTERDKKRAEYDAIFGKKELTDEQRVAIAEKSLLKSIADYERKIDEAIKGRFSRKPESKTPVTETLRILKSLRDSAKAELEELKAHSSTLNEEAKEKRLQSSISDLEEKLSSGDIQAKKPGVPEGPETQKVSELNARRKELSQKLKEAREASPEVQQAKMDAAEEAVRKSIEDYDKRIKAGDLSVRSPGTKPVSSALEQLRAERDSMKDLLNEMRQEAKPKTPEHEKQLADLQKKIDAAKAKIASGKIDPKTGKPTVDTKEVAAARAELADLNKQMADMRRGPKLTPEEIALKAFKTRTLKRIAELQDKTARGDFSTKKRVPIDVSGDKEASRLQNELEKVKIEYYRANAKDRLDNRTKAEKLFDGMSKYRRAFILSHPGILLKLTMSAAEIMAINPALNLIGHAMSKVPGISEVAKRAPREGRFSLNAEKQAIIETYKNFWSDMKDYMKTGHTGLDRKYGRPDIIPHHYLDWIGGIHGALKTSAKRNEFTRSLVMRLEHAADNGLDITDPAIRAKAEVDAYRDANAAIFMDDNAIATMIKRATQSLAEPDKRTGHTPAWRKAAQFAVNYELPIVKIPTNIVKRVFQYHLGSGIGVVQLAHALATGVEKIPEWQADQIMQNLKRGSVGAAVFILGYAMRSQIGGLFQQGEKKDEKDVPHGKVRVGDYDIPRAVFHHPAATNLMMGATLGRLMDHTSGGNKDVTDHIIIPLMKTEADTVKEAPFIRLAEDITKVIEGENRWTSVIQNQAKGIVPGIVSDVASGIDTPRSPKGLGQYPGLNVLFNDPNKRYPETTLEAIKTQIPGLREQVSGHKKKRLPKRN